MKTSLTHPAAALSSEVPGRDRLRGRTQAELTDALTFMAWYAPGTFTAVMDYMDRVDDADGMDDEFTPAR